MWKEPENKLAKITDNTSAKITYKDQTDTKQHSDLKFKNQSAVSTVIGRHWLTTMVWNRNSNGICLNYVHVWYRNPIPCKRAA